MTRVELALSATATDAARQAPIRLRSKRKDTPHRNADWLGREDEQQAGRNRLTDDPDDYRGVPGGGCRDREACAARAVDLYAGSRAATLRPGHVPRARQAARARTPLRQGPRVDLRSGAAAARRQSLHADGAQAHDLPRSAQ